MYRLLPVASTIATDTICIRTFQGDVMKVFDFLQCDEALLGLHSFVLPQMMKQHVKTGESLHSFCAVTLLYRHPVLFQYLYQLLFLGFFQTV